VDTVRWIVCIHREIHCEKDFMRHLYPKCALRGATIEACMQHYHDILFQEQRINPNIYSGLTGPLCNVVLPILPETTSPCFDQFPNEILYKGELRNMIAYQCLRISPQSWKNNWNST
jgi:hypothetical protein